MTTSGTKQTGFEFRKKIIIRIIKKNLARDNERTSSDLKTLKTPSEFHFLHIQTLNYRWGSEIGIVAVTMCWVYPNPAEAW